MEIIDKLMAILGEENVIYLDRDKLVYSTDASILCETQPNFIVFPTDATQVSELIRLANRLNFSVDIRGAGTGKVGGAVSVTGAIVLDLSKFNKIVQLNVKEKLVTLEPGVVLKDLNDFISEFGLLFPIVPESESVCTVGGMISTNAVGYRSQLLGRVIDWIEDIDVIDGTGKYLVIRKNTLKDFCGKEGLNGIIVRARLKLREKFSSNSASLVKFESLQEILKFVSENKNNEQILTMEFIDKLCSKFLDLDYGYYLLLEFTNAEQGNAKDEESINKIFALRKSMLSTLLNNLYTLDLDVSVSFEGIENFILFCESNTIPCYGHIGLGIFNIGLKETQKELIDEIFSFSLRDSKNDLAAKYGIGVLKRKYGLRKTNYAMLKESYDPRHILNKGKVL